MMKYLPYLAMAPFVIFVVTKVKFETYLPIGYAVDNGEIIFILGFEGLKHFEPIGEL
jgi:hypothetical protein